MQGIFKQCLKKKYVNATAKNWLVKFCGQREKTLTDFGNSFTLFPSKVFGILGQHSAAIVWLFICKHRYLFVYTIFHSYRHNTVKRPSTLQPYAYTWHCLTILKIN